jgi:hypothetical protein
MDELKVGDPVIVMDPGLTMLQRFAPPGAKPNNHGWVMKFESDGEILVEFPIGDDDPDEHSQVAPYPRYMLKKRPGEPRVYKDGE